jgi:hypothetical protein
MGATHIGWTRRAALAASVAAALVGCSPAGPEQAEALQQIAERIRGGFSVGEKQLANLTYKNGIEMDDGRFAVTVDYDLISTMPEVGLFNTQLRAGQASHVADERYIFVRSGGEWKLQ